MHNIKWKNMITALAIPLGVGGLSALLTRKAMSDFQDVKQPPLAPPMWAFPVAWTILYLLMGIASYLIAEEQENNKALILYAVQLAVNFFWSIWFFNLRWYLFSFFWLVLLWFLILATAVSFYRLNKKAAFLLIPYLLWVTFAGYLNLGIYLLN